MSLLSWISLAVAFVCALIITYDEIRRPQNMAVMNIVWPITALYGSVFALWFYFRAGRPMSREHRDMQHSDNKPAKRPSLRQVAIAASHCGAGCTLADIVTESLLFALGVTLLGNALYASFLWDFLAAWLLGIAFQYFSIQPMRDLTPAQGLLAAIKADTLSILAFQVGMYGWMAVVYFWLFPQPHLHPNHPLYWLMMQVGMIAGFLTAMPMNWLLVKVGWKEAMG